MLGRATRLAEANKHVELQLGHWRGVMQLGAAALLQVFTEAPIGMGTRSRTKRTMTEPDAARKTTNPPKHAQMQARAQLVLDVDAPVATSAHAHEKPNDRNAQVPAPLMLLPGWLAAFAADEDPLWGANELAALVLLESAELTYLLRPAFRCKWPHA